MRIGTSINIEQNFSNSNWSIFIHKYEVLLFYSNKSKQEINYDNVTILKYYALSVFGRCIKI